MKRVSLFLIVPVAFAGWCAAGAPAMPSRGLCAHRGASETHPENTLAAFREAARLGAQMIEFDVHLTKDRAPVIMHDLTVDRTTDGKGRIADMTLSDIKKLDAGVRKAPAFKGEKVPTLDEALAVMPYNVWLNIHLKGDRESGAIAAKAVLQAGRVHQAVLACGHEAAEAARAAVPGISICNMERQMDAHSYVDDTIAVHAEFIQLLTAMRPTLKEDCARLKAHGIRVNYFTDETPDGVRALFAAGVDFPLVNNVAALQPVAAEAGISPVTPIFDKP